MTPNQLLRRIRHHYAVSSIGPSASRRMIRKGDIEHIRRFLDRLDLRRFNRPAGFNRALDLSTKSLAKLLPQGRWGAARKFLHLYLRNATYNFYLRQAYRLDRVEHLLELPMDSFAAKGLRKRREGRGFPSWKGVIHLTPEANAAYQAAASEIGDQERIHRVHLDMWYWRAKR
jgi:hypothetical protein